MKGRCVCWPMCCACQLGGEVWPSTILSAQPVVIKQSSCMLVATIFSAPLKQLLAVAAAGQRVVWAISIDADPHLHGKGH